MKMVLKTVLVLLAVILGTDSAQYRHFPDNFLWGVSTSAYQIEGAVNEGGKGVNIWDRFIHDNRSRIENNDTADIACDSYHKYREDVALTAKLGFNCYRISVSWSRILPSGFANKINEEGLKYYEDLVNEIVDKDMIPIVTLYHWDLPQPLQDLGGWTNVKLVDYFVDFSRIVIRRLKKVKYWITFNEPRQICLVGYGKGERAPGIISSGIGEYDCAYVVMKSHAAVYHMYKREFPDHQGKMTITMGFQWSEPKTNSTADKEAAERNRQFFAGIYLHPIFRGDWPQVVKERVAKRSQMENFPRSRLPEFTSEEIGTINGTFDFLGLNTYVTFLVNDVPEGAVTITSQETDARAKVSFDPSWPVTNAGFTVVPWGARKVLQWLQKEYNNPEILITEVGYSDTGTLNDNNRIQFFKDYFNAFLDAMYEDGVRIFGIAIWSLLDNFEWTVGYRTRFGIYRVNFTDPARPRTAKKSTGFFRDLIRTGVLYK